MKREGSGVFRELGSRSEGVFEGTRNQRSKATGLCRSGIVELECGGIRGVMGEVQTTVS